MIKYLQQSSWSFDRQNNLQSWYCLRDDLMFKRSNSSELKNLKWSMEDRRRFSTNVSSEDFANLITSDKKVEPVCCCYVHTMVCMYIYLCLYVTTSHIYPERKYWRLTQVIHRLVMNRRVQMRYFPSFLSILPNFESILRFSWPNTKCRRDFHSIPKG